MLVILEGLPYKEAGEILECSEDTVAWRVHEARKQLRERLGHYLGDPAEPDDTVQAGPKGDVTRRDVHRERGGSTS